MSAKWDNTPAKVLRSAHGNRLRGTIWVPGDKSISHRAVILGGLAEGETTVENLLEGQDVLCTIRAMRAMGVTIDWRAPGAYVIHGVGLEGLGEPQDVIDLGNSGTSIRLLAGVLASQPFFSVLTGDASLRQRPMGRVTEPLTRMGATILGRGNGKFAPLMIKGTELLPLEHRTPVASAQIKSAILLAGLNTPGETCVTEPALSRDHTERMLEAFGATIKRDGLRVCIDGWATLRGQDLSVPGDISAAAFPLVAALLVPGSEVTLPGVGINPTRTGLLDILAAMGGQIEIHNQRLVCGEPVGDLQVRHSPLRGVVVPPELAPRMIDEFPIFFVAAALAEGETVVSGVEELRVKESDRLATIGAGLSRLGVKLEELPDGMRIQGSPGGLKGGCVVDSHTDHRIAMSLLVAGLTCSEPVLVTRCENIATSFPNFAKVMAELGADIAPPQQPAEELDYE